MESFGDHLILFMFNGEYFGMRCGLEAAGEF